MKRFKFLLYCLLILGCTEMEEKHLSEYNSNIAFRDFAKDNFLYAYRKDYGFNDEDLDLEKLKKKDMCRYDPSLNFQIINFCPFYKTCYTVIHDIKSKKFYYQEFIPDGPFEKGFKNQLDTTDKTIYYTLENNETSQYSLISNILNDRYSTTKFSENDFEGLISFLTTPSNGSKCLILKQDDIKGYYKEMLHTLEALEEEKEIKEYQISVFKKQMNYVYNKINTPYFLVLKYPDNPNILTFELKVFNQNERLNMLVNNSKTIFPIKYRILYNVFPTYRLK